MSYEPDLLSLNKQELLDLKKDIDKALEACEDRAKLAIIEQVKELAGSHDMTVKQLFALVLGDAKPSNPAKYRSLSDPNLSWTGRGRKPNWVIEHLEAGKPLSDLEVDPAPATAAESKGPIYINPENPDQKWAGRGKKPGWLVKLLDEGKTLQDLAA